MAKNILLIAGIIVLLIVGAVIGIRYAGDARQTVFPRDNRAVNQHAASSLHHCCS